MNQRQFDASIKSHVRVLLYCEILSPFSVWKFEVLKLNLNNVGVSSETKLYLLGLLVCISLSSELHKSVPWDWELKAV